VATRDGAVLRLVGATARRSATVAVIACLALTHQAFAQRDPASAQFDFGLAEMKAGRYDSGCPALGESYKLDPRPGVLFTLAECEREWGKVATALADYNAYLSNYARMNATEQAAQAEREQLALAHQKELKLLVPELTISLGPDVPRGARATRDGVLLDEAVLGAALPVDPGEHHIRLQMADGAVHEWTVVLAQSERRELVLSFQVTPVKPTILIPERVAIVIPTAEPSGLGPRRTWAIVLGASGLAGIVVGSVAGGLALSADSAAKAACGGASTCSSPQQVAAANAKESEAQSDAHVSTVAFCVSVAMLGAAAVLWLIGAREARITPVVSLTFSGLQGTW